MSIVKNKEINFDSNDLENWFDDVINNLNVDKMMLQTKTADPQKTSFYNNLMSGNATKIHHTSRSQSSMYFIQELLKNFINELVQHERMPLELAFDFSDAKILVWAKINNDDEPTEDALLLSEAKANAKFFDYGFFISSTIVEERDNLSIPPHYKAMQLV